MKLYHLLIILCLAVTCYADVFIQKTTVFHSHFPGICEDLQRSIALKYSEAILGNYKPLEQALLLADDPIQNLELDLFNQLFFINPANNSPSDYAQMRVWQIYRISEEPEAYMVILQRVFGNKESSSITTHHHVWVLKDRGWYLYLPDMEEVFRRGVNLPH